MKIITIYLFFIITLFFITFTSCHINEILLDEETNFIVSWEYNSENITFELEGDFKGWFAFGYSCSSCDPNSMEMIMGHPDLVLVQYDKNGIPTVTDMIEKMDSSPMQQRDIDIGGQDNILRYGGYQSSHHSLIFFTRKLKTGDGIGDFDIDINAEALSVTWYIGTDNNFKNFDSSSIDNLGTNGFNLITGETVQGGTGGHNHSHDAGSFTALYHWHAALMYIAFAFLIPFGIFCARYLKSYQWGFYLHLLVQSTALAFIIVGFILILIAHGGIIETSPHSILGVILASLVFATALMGIVSYFWKSKDDGSAPLFPTKIHGYVGKMVALLSVATIITGLHQYDSPTAFIIVFSILVLTYFIITTAMEIFKRTHGEKNESNVKLNNFN